MGRKEDPNAKKAFDGLIQAARDEKAYDRLAGAEQAMIAYYYDTLKAKAAQMFSKGAPLERVPAADMQDAVRAVNQACVDQKKPYLFTGSIDNPADLFLLAKSIAAPAAAQAAV